MFASSSVPFGYGPLLRLEAEEVGQLRGRFVTRVRSGGAVAGAERRRLLDDELVGLAPRIEHLPSGKRGGV